MSAKSRLKRRAKAAKGEGRVFVTAGEVMSHFLPNRAAQRRIPSGRDLGAQVAERTFAGLSGGRPAAGIPQKL
jgi:hypothetical protein